MKKHFFPLLIFCFAYFSIVHQVFGASVTMQDAPTQIGVSDEYTLSVTLSINATNGTIYYLRGVFYTPGTSQYCGFTWNGNSWFNGPYTSNNGWQNLLPVTVNNNTWSGQLKAKIDTTDANCSSSGQYNFKIQRYTSSGSPNFDTQTEQTVTITIPTPTPTPTEIPSPTPTPRPSPTNSPTPTPKISTPTPTLKPSSTPKPPTVTPTDTQLEGARDGSVLHGEITPTDQPSPTTAVLGATSRPNIVAIIFFVFGGILFAVCGILLFRQFWLSRQHEGEDSN